VQVELVVISSKGHKIFGPSPWWLFLAGRVTILVVLQFLISHGVNKSLVVVGQGPPVCRRSR
jgi:hypothetical protein